MGQLADWTSDLPWAAIVTLVAGSSLVTVMVGKLMDHGAGAAIARREGYARAAKALVAWHEYPYRIRRRTSNNADVVAELVGRGHSLQEELAAVHAWVSTDAPWVGEVFAAVRNEMNASIGPCCKEAWETVPAATTAGMNIDNWGPASPQKSLAKLHKAASWRFGAQRLLWFIGRHIHRPKDAD